jgi:UDP-glucose 4-epimerase
VEIDMTTENWLITGGCGFIGTSLISHLLKNDANSNIRILDNLSTGTREDLSRVSAFSEKRSSEIEGCPSGVELVEGDITNAETCLHCCEGITTVVHLAASTGVAPSVDDPRFDMTANVLGTFNMLEASRDKGVKKFVFASSGAPLGEVDPPIHEEKAPKPVSPYGASKLAGEGYCSAYFRTFGLKTVSLRFGNVYGPMSIHKESVVAKFFKQALTGETLEIYGDGTQTRDFIFIDDLIQAIMLSVKTDVGGEVFQIATNKETTVNEIADTIKKIVEEEKGNKVNVVHDEARLGDVKRNFSDISKARTVLVYEPRFDLMSGLKQTLKYFTSLTI